MSLSTLSVETSLCRSALPGAAAFSCRHVKMAGKLNKQKMQAVCDELAKGKSLRSICTAEDMPHFVTVLQAVQRDDDLHEMYTKARAIGAEILADEMFDLARQPLDGFDKQLANAEVQRRRVEIDTMKWVFARMQPIGIRNNVEDTAQSGVITLSWGGGTDEAMQRDEPAEAAKVLTLVQDDPA